ncbi:MAG TPA: baseplate J/gp47 family protein [Solirubrobacteraceae bacterium]|nr:baseplate J/gp47 family protein [Solirubrobacteraceae bacterium]
MAQIRRVEGRPTIDYTARDYDSILAAMRSLIPGKLPEWTDHASEADVGNVLLQLFAHMGDVLSYHQDRVANESFLTTARTRRSVIAHLRLIGYELGTAAPAAAALTVSVPAAENRTVTIGRGDAFATRSERDAPSIRFEYNGTHPLTVDLATLAVDEATGRKAFELAVEEGRLIRDELLGVSDGSPNQRFRLHHSPFILRSRGAKGHAGHEIALVTRRGGAVREWTLRETLAFSQSAASPGASGGRARDFVVEIDDEDQATVAFGDDVLGAIPDQGAEVRATYRVGGGAAGNVPAGSIDTIVASRDLALAGARVTNEQRAHGGSDRETIERAVRHAPAVFRSMRRAVTAADYEALTLDFPGVGKVRAAAANWNTVRLHVAPAGGGTVTDVLRAGLLAYFEDRRPLSTRIEVRSAAYVDVQVAAEIGVLPYYSSDDVAEQVRSRASDVLAFEHVDFGRPMFLSRFYEVIEAVDGVNFANVTEFRRSDRPADPANPAATVDPTGVLALGEHEIPRAPDRAPYGGGVAVVVKEGVP